MDRQRKRELLIRVLQEQYRLTKNPDPRRSATLERRNRILTAALEEDRREVSRIRQRRKRAS